MSDIFYNPVLYRAFPAVIKVKLPFAHQSLIHMGCGGKIGELVQYWDAFHETVGEKRYCNGCERDLRWNADVRYLSRRAARRAAVLDAPLPDYDFPAEELEY